MFDKKYDVIVVGGGHAGAEAAAAAANIQFKMLNKSKGPAMWSPRAQNDRMRFAEEWRLLLEQTDNVDFYQEMVSGLILQQNKVVGVKTSLGISIYSKSVVLTNGTFLNGLIHIGDKPRVDGRSLDYEKMIPQPGDKEPERFSYLDTPLLDFQRDCHMTHTSNEVHDLLREGFDRSPMFNGRIKSIGPRYCPSDVQFKALRSVKGFKNVKFFRPGYAIEYDYFPPTQLKNTLETKLIENLFFAGQINGTTGYEEAASQGLMAGINAHLKINEKEAFILKRDEAYIVRQDNADLRLTPKGYVLGLASEDRIRRMEEKQEQSKNFVDFFRKTSFNKDVVNPILEYR